MRQNEKEPSEELDEEVEEPSIEDFFREEPPDEEEIQRKQRSRKLKKWIALLIAGFLILNAFGLLLNYVNADLWNLWQSTEELMEREEIQEMSEAVVTIHGHQSRGTGFAISGEGLILTNDHVIDEVPSIIVAFPSGELYEGEVIWTDPALDVALLQIEAASVPHLPLSKEDAAVDDTIYVIGNPLSQSQIVNEGVVLEQTREHNVLQITNPIYPGHSGSPVINEQGEVVGVVYARPTASSRMDEGSTRGLAVPISDILPLLNEH